MLELDGWDAYTVHQLRDAAGDCEPLPMPQRGKTMCRQCATSSPCRKR